MDFGISVEAIQLTNQEAWLGTTLDQRHNAKMKLSKDVEYMNFFLKKT